MGDQKQVLIVCDPNIDLPSDLLNVVLVRGDLYDRSTLYEVVDYIQKIKLPDIADNENYSDFKSKLITYHTDPLYFDKIDHKAFEQMIFDLFNEMGHNPKLSDPKHFTGYDFSIENFQGFEKVVVEVRKLSSRSSRLSIAQVQKLMRAVYGADADCGVLISNTEFTSSAKDFAQKCSPKIQLLDMEQIIHIAGIN